MSHWEGLKAKLDAPSSGWLRKLQTNAAESFQQYLQSLLSFMDSLKQSTAGSSGSVQTETSELETLKDKYQKLQQEQDEARQLLEKEMGVLEERLKIKTQGEDTRMATALPTRLPEVTLRREFRICGQIGEADKKEKLSYTSLINQIESGQRKGHSEAEIIEAVISAVSPGLHLRETLEIKRGLTLPTLNSLSAKDGYIRL